MEDDAAPEVIPRTPSSGTLCATCQAAVEWGCDLNRQEGESQVYDERAIWRHHCPDFDDRLRTVQQWLQDCRSRHGECRQDVKIRPARLLDLSSVALSGEVKLVLTADIPAADVRYTALSHCWGTGTSEPPPKTNGHNQQNHMRGILLTDLPRNFQDAVAISLKLGIPYLWIDSLCILQDDKEEWEQEAMKMAHIYEGGVLTIAAAGSPDAYGGIINRLDQPTYTIPHPHAGDQVGAGPAQPSLIVRQQCHQHHLHSSMNSNYRQRGWILQELALSPRTIFFTKGQFFWQCRRFFESEDKAYRSSQFEALFKT
ncbi:heterokaryon incompatibility protein-domain-containing protein [Cladorrhinum samala]|uniref:Heterokaryon incompatibility protein-domain-containing protein n=1 Tax=Cladorrhinum samala TaxID=585594 RepID=A0AAV9HCX0_9PEZI|nr:heterokaryon incompatibility protein-domain-containing protein [Cladorrhinum samala]